MTSSPEAMKQAAQEWVDQAIASGANPRMILEYPFKTPKRSYDGKGVDRMPGPGRLPDDLAHYVFNIIQKHGAGSRT